MWKQSDDNIFSVTNRNKKDQFCFSFGEGPGGVMSITWNQSSANADFITLEIYVQLAKK